MKYFLLVAAAALGLSACTPNFVADNVPKPPVVVLPDAPASLDNKDLCKNIVDLQASIDAWKAWAQSYANLFDIDIDAKLKEFDKDLKVLEKIEKARNIACVTE